MRFTCSSLRQFVFFLFLFSLNTVFAIDYYQRQSGAWNDPLTWTTSTVWNATVNNGTYPKAGDNVYIKNNGNLAEITLTEDAVCQNLYFPGSDPAGGKLIQGNYNLTVLGTMQLEYGVNAVILQDAGYLQVNAGITLFQTDKTIKNFRVGSSSFVFNPTNDIKLTVLNNYDFFCYNSTVPFGINASSAIKHNATPCSPTIVINTSALDFGHMCVNNTSAPMAIDFTVLVANSTDIAVGPAVGFEFASSENGNYQQSLNISHSGGNFMRRIFVRFAPTAIAAYNTNVSISGGGAIAQSVAVAGNGVGNAGPTLSNIKTLQIFTDAAILQAEIALSGCDNSSVIERGFVYSTVSGFNPQNAARQGEQGVFGLGEFSAKVSGLQSNTTYYYRAYAANAHGTTYSPEYSFNNQAYTYYSRTNGNWTNRDVWSTVGCGQNVNVGNYPLAKDNVVICQQHNIVINTTGLACKNLDMSIYASQLVLQADFQVNGDLVVSNQSRINVGEHLLHVVGAFTNMPDVYNSSIDYSSGTVRIDGNIHVGQNGTGPFNNTGSGLLIFNGSVFTTTTTTIVTVNNLQQSAASFVVNGTGGLSVLGTFNQNNGILPSGSFTVDNNANTINIPTVVYRTLSSGNISNVGIWQVSNNSGNTWESATQIPGVNADVLRVANNHTLTVNQNVNLKSLVVEAGATVNINSTSQLKLNNSLVNNGTIRLLSDVNGTAILLPAQVYNGVGSFVVQQYLPEARNWYMSSPLPNATTPTAISAMFVYRENGDNIGASAPESAYWKTVSNVSELNAMQGFVLVPSSVGTAEFSSNLLNFSNNTLTLSRTAGKQKEGFNLIGNPFTAPLNVQSELLANPNIESSIWYRTRIGTNYMFATVNLASGMSTLGASALVPPMQAFWVRVVNTPTTSITFSPENLMAITAPLKIRGEQNNKIRMLISNNLNVDETIIYFDERALDGFDKFDSRKEFNNNAKLPEIYTAVSDKKLAINGLNAVYDGLQIPIGISVLQAGEYAIELGNTPEVGAFDFVLIDGLLGVETLMKENTSYRFYSDVYNASSRFKFVLRAKDMSTDAFKANNVKQLANVYVKDHQIKIDFKEQAMLQIFNVAGQMVYVSNENYASVSTPILKKGVYVVKLISSHYEQIQRVVLK